MVMKERDYRFCVKMSLQVLAEQRKQLMGDSTSINPTIRTGLHKSRELESAIRHLYFEKYSLHWLDEHWAKMHEILDRHSTEYSKEQQKDITLFFAEHFGGLFSTCFTHTPVFMKSVMPELLKQKSEILQMLINFNDKWEQNSKAILADVAKHDEQYRLLIQKAEQK